MEGRQVVERALVRALLLALALIADAATAAKMPAGHWIGPEATPEQFIANNAGLYAIDEAGILVTLYRDRHDQRAPRKEYNPAFIANYAISACRAHVATGDTAALATARKQLDWLLSHGQPLAHGDIQARMYPYTFDWVKFRLKAPWVSAFAQSLVGVAFACGADATGSSDYLRGARLAFNGMRIPVHAGGVTTFSAGSAWFEEAARADFPSIKILNGHLTAAEGLKNFIDWKPDPIYRQLWDQHVLAVQRNLPRYDAGFLSYYSQYESDPEPSGRRGYNAVHVIQLTGLYEATGKPDLLRYALKFAEYETPGLTITTAGSTAADTNGPDRIHLVMGNEYWSHGSFPTWAMVDMGEEFDVRGLFMVAHTAASAPRRFTVETSNDGKFFAPVATSENNEAPVVQLGWPARRARYVRVNIASDNGNQNVTLKGLYPVRVQPYGAVVGSVDHISVSNMPAMALKDGGWMAPRVGWLAFRRDALPSGIRSITFAPASAGVVQAEGAERPLTCSASTCRYELAAGDQLVKLKWKLAGAGPVKVRLR
jgi:hypothetical protein